MGTLDLIVAGACGVFLHAVVQLWRRRHAPGAFACLVTVAAAAVYALTVVHAHPSVSVVQTGYIVSALIPPLLLIVTVEYTGLVVPGWKRLRLLLLPAAALIAIVNVAGDAGGLLAAVAAEADLHARAVLIDEARRAMLIPVRWQSQAFVLLAVMAAGWTLVTVPGQRRETLVLVVVPALVAMVEGLHQLTGFTVAGAIPTPFAIAAGLVIGVTVLYSADVFDLGPVARATLVDNVVDGMLVMDAAHRIIDCNRAAEHIVGHDRATLIGRPAAELLPRELVAMLQSPVHLRSELAVQTRPPPRWFEVDVTPLTLRGRAAGHLLVVRDISERRRAQDALEQSREALIAANARLVEQSTTDPLTGLRNRRFLFQRLNEEMNRHHRSGGVLGLLLVDIDHFKTVNDTHGHPVGDQALVQVARTLTSLVRDCDVVARLGGEEFAVLAVNSDAAGLVTLAERIRQAMLQVPVARDTYRPMVLTVSIGVAFAGPATRTVEGLFAEADRHLYAAKHQGRNRVVAASLPLGASGTG